MFFDISEEQLEWLLQAEGLFIEDGVEYWLPVQTHLLPYMYEELASGNEITLLLVWAGWIRVPDEIEWIFVVNTY